MSTAFWVPGPAQISVGTGGTDAAPTVEFLGFSEREVAPEVDGLFVDEGMDYAGSAPADVNFQGEVATISMVLKRFDPAVLRRLLARVRGNTPGQVEPCTIGTLMGAELKAVQLFIKAPYVACKPTFYGAAVAGMRFPTAYLAGNVAIPHSTRAQKIPLVFRAFARIDPTATGAAHAGLLYDFDMTNAAVAS